MKSSTLYQMGWERYSQMRVKLIAIPLPPAPVNGLIYHPESFVSKTFDKNSIPADKDFSVIAIRPSVLGPVVLSWVPLAHLLSPYKENQQYMGVESAAICASVDFYPYKDRSDGAKYTSEVVVTNFNFAWRSCNPGSHYIVPKAPFLTSLLQYAQSEEKQANNQWFKYLSPDDAEKFFPNTNFGANQAIDRFVSNCPIHQAVTFSRASRLGGWTLPFLQKMRRNNISSIEEKESHEVLGYSILGGQSEENDREVGDSALSRRSDPEVC